jgi:hypothetical protein
MTNTFQGGSSPFTRGEGENPENKQKGSILEVTGKVVVK